ncbi:response regulator [Christensenellaceae bacterium OttesenSCG-928-K19]|nr:response regulator [Christensenellaceae bacterium OttesenSCG-928-K19]
MQPNEKIILVIDDTVSREKMHVVLEEAGYAVLSTATGEDGLRLVQREKPDLVLLDVLLPEIDGFEVCRTLRASESNNLMPIIMVSSQCTLDDRLCGLESGADDYINKPFDDRELLIRIKNTFVRLDRVRAANPLTGLPGNLEIQREINGRIASGEFFSVIYTDLDNFKAFNDVYGFAKGDMAIKMTADILTAQTKLFGNKNDFVGHIGGDDFVIVSTPDRAPEICKNAIAQFDEKIRTLFTEQDVKRGYISSVNRKGQTEAYPITTLSMGIISNEKRKLQTHVEVSDIASELKFILKSLPGSNFIKDRRTSFKKLRK